MKLWGGIIVKKIFLAIFVFVMLFGSINAFAGQTVPEYNTSVSGDIVLNLNDNWQPGFEFAFQHMYLPPDITYVRIFANVHIIGNTDADNLIVESAEFSSLTEKIEIDENGNFDQVVKVILTGFGNIESDTINFGAYVNAIKGDKSVRVKIGKGELKTDFLKYANGTSDGSLNSIDYAILRQQFLDGFMDEYNGMDKQESINAYIYNEWYMREFVPDKDDISFKALTHTKAKTDAANITLELTNNGNTKKYEYLTSTSGNNDQIEELEGVIPLAQAHDIAASAKVKVCKGNREIQLLSTLRKRESSNAIVGDIDGNKKVNSIDFMILRKYIMGLIDRFPLESGFYCADVDNSKYINALDFAYIRQYLLGIITEFPTPYDDVTPTPSIPTSTPSEPTTITPTPGTGMVTYYTVDGIDVEKNPGVEISIEKSPTNKIWVSAKTVCRGPLYADGYAKTYFTLSGSAVNGVDYEKIDFDYFWRIIGSDLFMPIGDNNPKDGFYITPIDTGTDETKDVEIYFSHSDKPSAIIHLTKNTSDQSTNNN